MFKIYGVTDPKNHDTEEHHEHTTSHNKHAHHEHNDHTDHHVDVEIRDDADQMCIRDRINSIFEDL